MEKKRLLIVDDDQAICNLLQETFLYLDYHAEVAYDGMSAIEMVKNNHYGVVIADLAMPEMDGHELLRRIKLDSPETMVIIMTAYASFENVVASLKGQAIDFLKKPLPSPDELRAVVDAAYEQHEKALHNKQIMGNLIVTNEQLQEQVVTDGLTKLYNYSYFYERLNEEVKRSKRYNSPLSLIFIDIDDFKEINDSMGHLEGDRCLKAVADILQQTARGSDLVARYGGDEFVVILPNTEKEQTFTLVDRLRHEVMEKLIVPGLDHVSISAGIAVFPEEADSVTEFIKLADQRLYQAKSDGKNKIVSD